MRASGSGACAVGVHGRPSSRVASAAACKPEPGPPHPPSQGAGVGGAQAIDTCKEEATLAGSAFEHNLSKRAGGYGSLLSGGVHFLHASFRQPCRAPAWVRRRRRADRRFASRLLVGDRAAHPLAPRSVGLELVCLQSRRTCRHTK